jgi:hypothetical protein
MEDWKPRVNSRYVLTFEMKEGAHLERKAVLLGNREGARRYKKGTSPLMHCLAM